MGDNKHISQKVKSLYDVLKSNGEDVGSEQEFNDWFLKPGQEGYKNRKYLWDTFNQHGEDVGANYEEFASWLGLRPASQSATSPKAGQQTLVASGAKPLGGGVQSIIESGGGAPASAVSADTKAATYGSPMAVNAWLSSLRGQAAHGTRSFNERSENLLEHAKKDPLGRNTVKSGFKYNKKTGDFEQTYVTPYGTRHTDKAEADEVSRQWRDANDHSIEKQIGEAYREQERLEREIEARGKEIEQGESAVGRAIRRGVSGAIAGSLGGAVGKIVDNITNPSDYIYKRTDETYNQLVAASNANKERIKMLEAARDKGGFWRSAINATTDPNTWLFGAPGLVDAATLYTTSKKLERNGGDTSKLTEAEKSMLDNVIANSNAQGEYGDDLGFMYRAGAVTASALPFAVEFAVTGGFSGIANAGARMGEKLAAKAATKGITGKASQWLIKNTGVAAGDIASSIAMAQTTGAARTASDILGRHMGDATIDEQGNYTFKGGEDLATAAAKGVVSSTLEYYTEKLGGHLQLGKWLSKGAEKVGLSKLSKAINYASSNKWLEKGGVQDYPSEVLEEEANIVLNSLLVGDNKFSDLWDAKTQADIWGGMAFSLGFMNAPKYANTGYQAAQYYRYKHKTDKSDAAASRQIGAEQWQELKEKIDGADNERISDILNTEIIGNDNLSAESRKAAMDYAKNLLEMRGYNMGLLNSVKDDISDKEEDGNKVVDTSVGSSYSEGYNAANDTEAATFKTEYAAAKAKADETFDEETLALLDDNPVYTLSALRSSEEFTDEALAIAVDYVNAKAACDGAEQRMADDLDSEIDAARGEVTQRINGDDFMIHGAQMKADNADGTPKRVHIISGNVSMREDGSVDAANSSQTIVVRDAATGKIEMVSPEHIRSVEEAIDPQEEYSNAEAAARAAYEEKKARIQSAAEAAAEEEVTDTAENAENAESSQQFKGKKEQTEIQQVEDEQGNGQQIKPQAEGENLQTETQTGAEQAAAESPIVEQTEIPVEKDKKGNVVRTLYHKVPMQRTLEDLYDGSLDQEEIDGLVENLAADAKKRLTSVENEEKPKIGNNKQAYLEAKKRREDKLADARAEVEYYDNLQKEVLRVTQRGGQQTGVSEDLGGEPLSLEELAARFASEHKVTPESLKGETGMSGKELKGFVGLVAKEENGGVSIERLGELLARSDEWAQLGGTPEMTQEARNMLIDAYMSGNPRSYVKQQRERFAQREAEHEMNEIENFAQAAFGMSAEEYLAYEEQALPAIINKYTGFDFDIYYAILQEQADARANEAEANYNNSINGNTNEQQGESNGNGGSGGILQTEGTADEQGERTSDEQEAGGQGGVGNAGLQGVGTQRNVGEGEQEGEATNPVGGTRDRSIGDWFGPVYTQFEGRANEAEEYLRETTEGVAKGALVYPGVEPIDLVWGDMKAGYMKIVIKHPEVVGKLQEILSASKITSRSDNRIVFESDTHKMVVSKMKGSQPTDNWLLTAYEKKEKPASASSSDIETEPEGKRNGTATPQNGAISAGKVTEKENSVQTSIANAEAETETAPSEAQKKAGNYKKGHLKIDGFDVTIENPKGSVRSGVDAYGEKWEQTMNNTYGYIRGTEGVDGDHIDMFLSDDPSQGDVFVVDQVNKDGTFDEHKVMYGFADEESARQAYLSNYEDGWTGLGAITHVSKEEFKKWVDSSHRKTKPFAEYKGVKKSEATDNAEASNSTRSAFDNLKKKASDRMLIFKEGGNYEILYEDAKKAAEILELPVQKKDGKTFVSFPIEDLDKNLPLLIRGGIMVAITDELVKTKNQKAGKTEIPGRTEVPGSNAENTAVSVKGSMLSEEESARLSELSARDRKNLERRELEEMLTLERKDRILREGTYYDKPFGLKPAGEISSAEDIEENIAKIIKGLKTNEGDGRFKDFEGFAYGGNYAKNAGRQIDEYLQALIDVIPFDITKAWCESHGLETHDDVYSYGEKLYRLETIKRQAEREGGHILILPSESSEEAGGLSSRTPDLPSDGKVTEKNNSAQQGSKETDKAEGLDGGKSKKLSTDTKIDDVGERLEGARKDMRRKIAESLANVTEADLIEKPFGKVYKKPDLKKAVESGALREKDAIFYEALFSMVDQQKPKVTQKDMRSKRYIPDYKTKAERWAADTFKQMEVLRQFMEIDEQGRDAMMERMLADRYPTREQELADIEKRKAWNDNEGHKYEWGEMTTPNPLWVAYEVMNRMGYDVGDKLDIPFGVVKANTSGTGYSIENLKGEYAIIFGSSMTLDEAIDRIVYLAKLKRGDADISHPTQLFDFPATKSEMGESGRFRVVYGRDFKTREFDSKEDADAFASTKSGAYVSPIKEVRRWFGYKVRFIHPLTGEKMFVDGAEFDSKEEAKAYFDENFEQINDVTNTKLQEEREKKGEKKTITPDDVVNVTMVKSSGGWSYAVVVDKKYANNNGMVHIVKEGFASSKDAHAYADKVKGDIFNAIQKHKEDAKKIVYFDTGENSRIGEDYRNGKDVDAENFMNTFGFRGIQFGNWTNQEDRQMAINQAYDAFMDMARLIGVSSKAMSLNGELGIAFGARGMGNASAHYEPNNVVINLTKTQGAGSLAHEWWHALDNYFARRAGSAGGMVTENRQIEMRDALRKAFNDMLDMVKGSDYAKRSTDKGEYWGRTREITARLLSEWVDSELKKRGELNTFLSRGASIERYQKHNYNIYSALEKLSGREPMPFEEYKETPESLIGIPYPTAKEVEQFGASLRHIFDTLQEKVDEKTGKIALFHKLDGNTKLLDKQEVALRDVLVDDVLRGAAGMEVITDAEEGQRVLNEENLGDMRRQEVSGVRFFRTPDGHAYGFTMDGKIYIDTRIAGADTPIHEYTHLWAEALRKANPKEWDNIVGLMKGGPIWEEVKKKYPELKTDGEIADEVLAHYSGRRGADRLRKAQEEALKSGNDILEKTAAVAAINNVRTALKRFWNGVAGLFGVHFNSAEEVADKVLSDMLNGVKPEATGKTDAALAKEEAEIIANAKADGTYLKAPNGKLTNLTPRQWVQVRTKAFKKWFGDWEKRVRIEKLRKSESVSITGEEIEITDDYKQNKKNALEYGKRLQGEYTNADTGMSIQLQRGRRNGGIKEVLQHNYKDAAHILSVAAIPQIIEKSVYIESEANSDTAKNPDVVEYQHFVCGLKIGNEDYTVHSLVAVDKHGNRYYDHSLTHIEKTKLLDSIERQAVKGQGFDTTSSTELTTLNGYKGKKLLELLQTDCSKVVDENGEPNVVLHGTPNTFTEFDKSKIGSSNDPGWLGSGFYFYGNNEDYARSYSRGGNLMEVFLNIRDPYYASYSEMERLSEENNREASNEFREMVEGDGYDGVYYNADLNEEWVAFEPTQIKSATDNVGTFDGSNPDIRYQFVGENGAESAAETEAEELARDGRGAYTDDKVSMENDPWSKMAGYNIRSKKERMAFAERERRRMVDKITDMAERLGIADDVEIVTDLSGLQGRQRRAKGIYRKNNGKITIYIPNHVNVADAVATFLHEAVAHKGLRNLFGEHFDEFLDKVYDNADGKIWDAIDALAKKKKLSTRTATEEYLAGLAESTDFEHLPYDGWWQRVKELFIDMLHKVGIKALDMTTLTDNELRYILWRSYRYMTGKDKGIIAFVEDTSMKMKLGVGYSEKEGASGAAEVAGKTEVSAKNTKNSARSVFDNLKKQQAFDKMFLFKVGDNYELLYEDAKSASEILGFPLQEKDGKEYVSFPVKDLDKNLALLVRGGAYVAVDNNPVQELFRDGEIEVQGENSEEELFRDGEEEVPDDTENADETDGGKKKSNTKALRDILMFGNLSLTERTTAAKLLYSNIQNWDKKRKADAVKAIGENIADLAKAMRLQRDFDKATVKRVHDLARVLMESGYLSDLKEQEIKRLLAAVKNSVGKNDIDASVQKVMDIMIDNMLRRGKAALSAIESVRGSKTDTRGVEVQGMLGVDGQTIVKAFKEAKKIVNPCAGKTEGENGENTVWGAAFESVYSRMDSKDQAVADEAYLEYAGMQMAQQWYDEIAKSKLEEETIRLELKEEHDKKSAEERRTDSYREFAASMEEAIRQNKIERAQAYFNLAGRLSDSLRGSVENALAFKEAERQRIGEIHHAANSDMQGRSAKEHQMPSGTRKALNNLLGNYLFTPLATYMEMLRLFGAKSVNGEGYLFNRFGRGWIDARQKEIRGVRGKLELLDAKAKEVFGGKVKTWGDLIRAVGKLPKGKVSFFNGGEMQETELPQGNLMYIYMANKMLDGKMKLRKMGISEEDVAQIETAIDPRLKEIADWLQKEFLVNSRNEYNKTHKRMFGASMASVENYFPLRILNNALDVKADELDRPAVTDGISTITGSIIKRRRNSKPLDILNADALHVILGHVSQMEHWNAYAEFNRDLNTLRSYRHFRNQVQNMETIYGNGKNLWNKFNDVCQMAAGVYKPKGDEAEKAALAVAQGVTAAAVSFRLYTALKQFASFPAYIPYTRADYLAKAMMRPDKSWEWCMENLPIFEERWKSRVSGDPRLVKSFLTAADWRRNLAANCARAGMAPNAFIDALTCSMGAYAVYNTRKKQYLKDGYSEEQAERKAIQDAEMVYNETQQSGEDAFTSTMQRDRTWWKSLFTIFRNASMSYQRQLHGALRDLGNVMSGGVDERVAFVTKQLLREKGIQPNESGEWSEADYKREEAIAKRKVRRQFVKDGLSVATFGYIMQLAWNISGYLPYLLFGDDDETKDEFWDDIWTHTFGGWLEGFTGGDVMSLAIGMLLNGEYDSWKLKKEMPVTSATYDAIGHLLKGDFGAFATNATNLLIQVSAGVNPQSLTDCALAIMDACGGDPALANEAVICVSRILSVPQSQIDKMYFDEVGLRGDEVSKYTPEQLAERYALYKVKRGRFFAPWSWDDEELIEKQEEKANTAIKERLGHTEFTEVTEAYERYEKIAKEIGEQVNALKKAERDGSIKQDEGKKRMDAIKQDRNFNTYALFTNLDKVLEAMSKRYMAAKSPEEAAMYAEAVERYRLAMLDALSADNYAELIEAISRAREINVRTQEEWRNKYKK